MLPLRIGSAFPVIFCSLGSQLLKPRDFCHCEGFVMGTNQNLAKNYTNSRWRSFFFLFWSSRNFRPKTIALISVKSCFWSSPIFWSKPTKFPPAIRIFPCNFHQFFDRILMKNLPNSYSKASDLAISLFRMAAIPSIRSFYWVQNLVAFYE